MGRVESARERLVKTMTHEEVELLAHELRLLIQRRTCCAEHAGDVLLHVMAGFCLDDAQDNPKLAAMTLTKAAAKLAKDIRAGQFIALRTDH